MNVVVNSTCPRRANDHTGVVHASGAAGCATQSAEVSRCATMPRECVLHGVVLGEGRAHDLTPGVDVCRVHMREPNRRIDRVNRVLLGAVEATLPGGVNMLMATTTSTPIATRVFTCTPSFLDRERKALPVQLPDVNGVYQHLEDRGINGGARRVLNVAAAFSRPDHG